MMFIGRTIVPRTVSLPNTSAVCSCRSFMLMFICARKLEWARDSSLSKKVSKVIDFQLRVYQEHPRFVMIEVARHC